MVSFLVVPPSSKRLKLQLTRSSRESSSPGKRRIDQRKFLSSLSLSPKKGRKKERGELELEAGNEEEGGGVVVGLDTATIGERPQPFLPGWGYEKCVIFINCTFINFHRRTNERDGGGGEKRLHACTARACTGRNNAPLPSPSPPPRLHFPRSESSRSVSTRPDKIVSSLETTLLHSSCCVVSLVSNKTPFAKRRDGLILSRRFEDPPKSPLPRPLSTFFFFRSELIPPFPLLRRIGREWRGGLLCQLFPSFVPSKWLQRNSITNRG